MDIIELAEQNQQNAWKLLDETGIIPAWERIGATVHLVGSLCTSIPGNSILRRVFRLCRNWQSGLN